jgi:hypothetical protein
MRCWLPSIKAVLGLLFGVLVAIIPAPPGGWAFSLGDLISRTKKFL